MEREQFFHNFTDDFVATPDQDRKLPADYSWRQERPHLAHLVYWGARLLGGLYVRVFLHTHVRGQEQVAKVAGGAFIYANHTQPVGDVFVPMLAGAGKRVDTVAAPANLGVPVLGHLIKLGGGLVLPQNMHQLAAFNRELQRRIAAGHVVTVYPEAHVWPYATIIRPFVAGSMHYPVASQAPVFAMTTTYQRRRWGTKPRITVDIDGPFMPDAGLPRKQQQARLTAQVQAAMQARATTQNTYTYIKYIQK